MGQLNTNPVNDAGFGYQVHVQGLGWLPPVRDGQTAGTVSESKRVEALRFMLPEGLIINAKAHIQNIGWKLYENISASNSPVVGTVGEQKRIESLELDIVKNDTGKMLLYRVHNEDAGWTSWVEAGYATGAVGISKRIEAVQFKLV